MLRIVPGMKDALKSCLTFFHPYSSPARWMLFRWGSWDLRTNALPKVPQLPSIRAEIASSHTPLVCWYFWVFRIISSEWYSLGSLPGVCHLLCSHWHLCFYPLHVFDPYRLSLPVHHCEVKCKVASGQPTGHNLHWDWVSCAECGGLGGRAPSLREGISKTDIVNMYH